MKTDSRTHSFQLNLDQRRRPTLPASLLDEAGISAETTSLVGYSDRRGRIIIEDPMAALEELGEMVVAGMRERGNTLSLLDDLLQERASDTSLSD